MLSISNFSKAYIDNKFVVSNLNLNVKSGDIYGFIGPNGSGKSTTIRAITGCLNFELGNIYVDGKSIKTYPIECKKNIGYVPDNPYIYDYLTGIQYLDFIANIYNISSRAKNYYISKYSELLNMSQSLGNLIGSYSYGMKQKLVIISTLIHSPKLMVLDEPFSGLDPQSVYNLKSIMKSLCNEGTAIFFSSHMLEITEKLCNKVAIIKNGRLLVSGDINEVLGDKNLEQVFLEGIKNE